MRRMIAPMVIVLITTALVVACGGGSAITPSPPAPTASAGPGIVPMGSGDPSSDPSRAGESPGAGGRSWPTASNVALEPGRYSASPPFELPLTFDVGVGWESAHLHGEFVDLIRDVGPDGIPARWLAFARPAYIGAEPGTTAAGLSADDAITRFAELENVNASEPGPFELDGRAGARVDIHMLAPDTPLFGGAAGAFGQGPNQDVRLGVVEHEGGLLLVLALAAPADLDAAWSQVQPILESVDF